MARYWRMSGIRTPSNMLDVSALSLFDGTTDYPASVLTGALSSGFRIEWDLLTDVTVTRVKLTAVTQADFPIDLLLESSPDNLAWSSQAGVLGAITYPGDAAQAVVGGDLNAVLLPHFDVNLIDSSPFGNVITAVGNAQISNLQSKFGGYSAAFDGNGDYLTVTPNTSLNLAGTAFTVECWVYLTAYSGCAFVSDVLSGGSINYALGISSATVPGDLGATKAFFGSFNGTWTAAISTSAIPLNTWTHVAGVYTGSVYQIYLNGALEATSGAVTPPSAHPTDLRVGMRWDAPAGGYIPYMYGYMDELRISKGIARYAANFTLPSEPFIGATGLSAQAISASFKNSGVTNIADEAMPPSGLSLVPSGVTVLDTLDGGTGSISGTVAEKHLPTNTPLARRVVLMDERSRRVVRETWSDASGSYVFPDINTNTKYTVLSYDHTGTYRAVIADNLSPTPL